LKSLLYAELAPGKRGWLSAQRHGIVIHLRDLMASQSNFANKQGSAAIAGCAHADRHDARSSLFPFFVLAAHVADHIDNSLCSKLKFLSK
jgi:hypothetical protein